MLTFRHTCSRHQQMFVQCVERAGCSDPAAMDEVRRQMLAWLAHRYPKLMFTHFQEGSCLACEFEAGFGSLSELCTAIRDTVNGPGQRGDIAAPP